MSVCVYLAVCRIGPLLRFRWGSILHLGRDAYLSCVTFANYHNYRSEINSTESGIIMVRYYSSRYN